MAVIYMARKILCVLWIVFAFASGCWLQFVSRWI